VFTITQSWTFTSVDITAPAATTTFRPSRAVSETQLAGWIALTISNPWSEIFRKYCSRGWLSPIEMIAPLTFWTLSFGNKFTCPSTGSPPTSCPVHAGCPQDVQDNPTMPAGADQDNVHGFNYRTLGKGDNRKMGFVER
jgi:hypothetical protein